MQSKKEGVAAHKHTKFRHYVLSEIFALVVDIALLWAFVHFLHIHYLISAVIAYWIALTIHHHGVRKHLFRGTVRDSRYTYAYFLGVGMVGFLITVGFVTLAVSAVHLNYLFARFMVATGVIPVTYLLNIWLTFIMPKPLPDEKNEYCLVGEHDVSN